ncbi:MAG TPA: hypothetical protein DCS57_01785, partial [Dehalococcoidia bacterium]|nr:hypothetical protein [Dehalococcoidia bacterium]
DVSFDPHPNAIAPIRQAATIGIISLNRGPAVMIFIFSQYPLPTWFDQLIPSILLENFKEIIRSFHL